MNGYDIRLEGGKYRVTCNGVLLRKFRSSLAARRFVASAQDYDRKMVRALKTDAWVNDYAGDGLDERYEDDCASRCGF